MATEVILPKVDMDMEEGLVSTWHVKAGDTVSKGDALFDIETDKAAMEVEAPASGILAHVVAPEGTKVAVGNAVAWIYGEGEAIPDAAPGADDFDAASDGRADEGDPEVVLNAATGGASQPASQSDDQQDENERRDGVRATPAARRAARDVGLSLDGIEGSGPKGRVQAEDVERAVEKLKRSESQAPEPQAERAAKGATAAADGADSAAPRSLALTRRRGSGKGAPILLIHGFAADASGWAPLEKALGNEREIIRIDLASHGRSPVRGVDSFMEFAKIAIQAFDALQAGGIHLVGHSLGGAVAATIADIRPRAVRSLGLIAPAGVGPDIDGAVLAGIARATRTESLAPWLKRLVADPDTISWDFANAAMMARMDEDMRMAQRSLADVLFPDGTQSFDLRPALSRLEVPLSVLWGRNDRVIPWRHILRMPDRASLHLLDSSGHIPHIECPEACAEVLNDLFTVAEAR